MQPVPSAQPWQQYVSPSCVYPSPGHSFLTILQPGHAGTGTESSNGSLISVSLVFLSVRPFIKQKSILTGLLRAWSQHEKERLLSCVLLIQTVSAREKNAQGG